MPQLPKTQITYLDGAFMNDFRMLPKPCSRTFQESQVQMNMLKQLLNIYFCLLGLFFAILLPRPNTKNASHFLHLNPISIWKYISIQYEGDKMCTVQSYKRIQLKGKKFWAAQRGNDLKGIKLLPNPIGLSRYKDGAF